MSFPSLEGSTTISASPRPPSPMIASTNGWDAEGSSFPSTHAADYTAIFGFAAFRLWNAGRMPRVLAAVLVLLTAAIGPVRVLQGDHRVRDVVAGYTLGASYLGLLIWLRAQSAKANDSRPELQWQALPPPRSPWSLWASMQADGSSHPLPDEWIPALKQ